MKYVFAFLLAVLPIAVQAQRDADFDSKAEREIIELINKDRAAQGLGPVHIDEKLTQAARLHSQLMVDKHELSHRLPNEAVLKERVAATGLNFEAAGENVAYDWSVPHAHDEFMHSPGHRANILQSRFNAVGVGIMHSGNLIWVTEDFAQRIGVTSASEAATVVMDKFAELRKDAGSPPAAERKAPQLGKIACEMAHNDSLETREARKLNGVHEVMVWTTPDPAKLPKQVKGLADDRNATRYSLGVCFASSKSNPNKVFWMVMALYN